MKSGLIWFPSRLSIPVAAAGHELARQTITLMAPSKTFNIAGLHNSVAVIPNKEWKRSYDQATKRAYLGFANVFSVTAFTAAYCHGGEWLDQLLPYLKSNCDQVVAALDGYCSLRVRPPEGTYLVWLDFRGLELDQDLLIRMLVEHGKIGLSERALVWAGRRRIHADECGLPPVNGDGWNIQNQEKHCLFEWGNRIRI